MSQLLRFALSTISSAAICTMVGLSVVSPDLAPAGEVPPIAVDHETLTHAERAQFPGRGCRPVATFPPGVIPEAMIMRDAFSGDVSRVGFHRAVALAEAGHAWTLAACP